MPEMEPEPLSTNPTLSLPNSKTSLQVEMWTDFQAVTFSALTKKLCLDSAFQNFVRIYTFEFEYVPDTSLACP